MGNLKRINEQLQNRIELARSIVGNLEAKIEDMPSLVSAQHDELFSLQKDLLSTKEESMKQHNLFCEDTEFKVKAVLSSIVDTETMLAGDRDEKEKRIVELNEQKDQLSIELEEHKLSVSSLLSTLMCAVENLECRKAKYEDISTAYADVLSHLKKKCNVVEDILEKVNALDTTSAADKLDCDSALVNLNVFNKAYECVNERFTTAQHKITATLAPKLSSETALSEEIQRQDFTLEETLEYLKKQCSELDRLEVEMSEQSAENKKKNEEIERLTSRVESLVALDEEKTLDMTMLELK